MTPPSSASIRARLGLYAAVTIIVLAYVGLTTERAAPAASLSSTANREQTVSAAPSIQRFSAAGLAIALWIAVDLAAASYLRGSDSMTHYLVRVLLGWGALLALGAMLSAGQQRWLAAAIVFGMTAAFIGLWLTALSARRRAKAVR
jgi:hypothetical protein